MLQKRIVALEALKIFYIKSVIKVTGISFYWKRLSREVDRTCSSKKYSKICHKIHRKRPVSSSLFDDVAGCKAEILLKGDSSSTGVFLRILWNSSERYFYGETNGIERLFLQQHISISKFFETGLYNSNSTKILIEYCRLGAVKAVVIIQGN